MTPTSAATSCRSRRKSPAPSSSIDADDTQFVKAGQTLVRLDEADSKVALDQAEAQLARDGARGAEPFRDQRAIAERDRHPPVRTRDRANPISRAASASRAPARSPAKSCSMRVKRCRERARRSLWSAATVRRQSCPRRSHDHRRSSRREECSSARARRVSRLCTYDTAGAGRRLRRQARGAAGTACQPGHATDGDRAARPGLGRRQFQGATARVDARRPAGDAACRHLRRQDCLSRQDRRLRRGHRIARSRCCLRRTRPATGSRSCSAFRCVSVSTRRSLPHIRCRSACRCRPRSTRSNAPAIGCRSSSQPGEAYETDVFRFARRSGRRARQGDHRRQRARHAAARGEPRASELARRTAGPRTLAPERTRRVGAERPAALGTRRCRCPTRSPAAPSPPRAASLAPLTGSALVLGTIALSLATFMNVLDTSIANVSIPAIAGDLGVSPDQGTWVITSFGVANAISLPLTGWLTQRFGQVRLFTASVLLFVLSSFLCALAPSLGLLILFPRDPGRGRRPDDSAVAVAAVVELPQGALGHRAGDVVDHYAGRSGRRAAARRMDHRQHSWPWIFYINIPVGIAAAAVTWMIYRPRETADGAPADRRRRARSAGDLGRRAAGDARQGQGSRLVRVASDRDPRGRRRRRLRAVPRLGADRAPSCRRSATVRTRNFWTSTAGDGARLWNVSSAILSYYRCGCSSTWATPRRWRAWCWRRSACWPSCCRRWSAGTSPRSIRGCSRPLRSRSSPSCCSCAPSSTPTPTFAP